MEGTRVLRYRRSRSYYWMLAGLLGLQLAAIGVFVWIGWRVYSMKREMDRDTTAIEARMRARGRTVKPDPEAAEAERLWAQLELWGGLVLSLYVFSAGEVALGVMRERQRERNGGVAIGPEGLGVLDHRGRMRSVAWRDLRGGWHPYARETKREGPVMRFRARDGRRLTIAWGLDGWQDVVEALRDNCGLHPVRNWLGIVRYVKQA